MPADNSPQAEVFVSPTQPPTHQLTTAPEQDVYRFANQLHPRLTIRGAAVLALPPQGPRRAPPWTPTNRLQDLHPEDLD